MKKLFSKKKGKKGMAMETIKLILAAVILLILCGVVIYTVKFLYANTGKCVDSKTNLLKYASCITSLIGQTNTLGATTTSGATIGTGGTTAGGTGTGPQSGYQQGNEYTSVNAQPVDVITTFNEMQYRINAVPQGSDSGQFTLAYYNPTTTGLIPVDTMDVKVKEVNCFNKEPMVCIQPSYIAGSGKEATVKFTEFAPSPTAHMNVNEYAFLDCGRYRGVFKVRLTKFMQIAAVMNTEVISRTITIDPPALVTPDSRFSQANCFSDNTYNTAKLTFTKQSEEIYCKTNAVNPVKIVLTLTGLTPGSSSGSQVTPASIDIMCSIG